MEPFAEPNPESAEGKAVQGFCGSAQLKYIPFTERRSTSIRNEIFNNATAPYVISMDPHILFEPDTIKKLIKFYEERPDTTDLYHGPMLYDIINKHDPAGRMDPVWRDNMYGIWECDSRAKDPDNPPFEIDMHGLGVFSCAKEAWLGFNDLFKGFGGEEGYIHEKFRQAGRKTWCLPFFRWIHRFQRPRGLPYKNIIEERIRNYFIGFSELKLDLKHLYLKKLQVLRLKIKIL